VAPSSGLAKFGPNLKTGRWLLESESKLSSCSRTSLCISLRLP